MEWNKFFNTLSDKNQGELKSVYWTLQVLSLFGTRYYGLSLVNLFYQLETSSVTNLLLNNPTARIIPYFYIHGSVHHNSIDPTRCNCVQVFIYCKITLHISGVRRTHQQEYIKL